MDKKQEAVIRLAMIGSFLGEMGVHACDVLPAIPEAVMDMCDEYPEASDTDIQAFLRAQFEDAMAVMLA